MRFHFPTMRARPRYPDVTSALGHAQAVDFGLLPVLLVARLLVILLLLPTRLWGRLGVLLGQKGVEVVRRCVSCTNVRALRFKVLHFVAHLSHPRSRLSCSNC